MYTLFSFCDNCGAFYTSVCVHSTLTLTQTLNKLSGKLNAMRLKKTQIDKTTANEENMKMQMKAECCSKML